MIAPPGGAAAMYYTGPSEDFSRPGRTWYPTLGKTRFPLWGEVSICYHEGVPGHHLQIAQVRYLADSLSRFQRTLAGTSGHAEGWALYAERLMGELGYLDDPAYELGMLRAQAMRAVRVVVDIGMHLELAIPADERYHPGETWTPELALPFVIERSRSSPPTSWRSEVDRYLGLPGQAISYKVGERVWLGARDAARARAGACVRPQGVPPRRARPRPHGPRPARRASSPASEGGAVCFGSRCDSRYGLTTQGGTCEASQHRRDRRPHRRRHGERRRRRRQRAVERGPEGDRGRGHRRRDPHRGRRRRREPARARACSRARSTA